MAVGMVNTSRPDAAQGHGGNNNICHSSKAGTQKSGRPSQSVFEHGLADSVNAKANVDCIGPHLAHVDVSN